MSEKDKGVFMKYVLRKSDGSPVDPEACYLVLRLDTDSAARKAALEYAGRCLNREFAKDIVQRVNWLNNPPACNCGGRNDGINNCPLHDSMFNPVWRHGESQDTALKVEVEAQKKVMLIIQTSKLELKEAIKDRDGVILQLKTELARQKKKSEEGRLGEVIKNIQAMAEGPGQTDPSAWLDLIIEDCRNAFEGAGKKTESEREQVTYPAPHGGII